MYFTREPIIETIISPKEGYKLVLRSSKHAGEEEYAVDSVEVISFGNHCFYRSLDVSVSFLLPVFDYEIIETRSARLALKSRSVQEREIKIGKPREGGVQEEERKEKEKRALKKKKSRPSQEERVMEEEAVPEEEPVKMKEQKPRETPAFEPRGLIPPPASLISATISRYKAAPIVEAPEEIVSEESVEAEDDEFNI